jgi:hypothetical protein
MNHFKNIVLWSALALAVPLAVPLAQAAAINTVEAPTGFFTPTDAQKTEFPYYRYSAHSWGWAHGALPGSFSSATLNISAFDIDASTGEVDQVWAMDSGTWVLLGALAGNDNIFAFSNFTLGANFYDDINLGLQVRMDIDTLQQNWAVSLAKSTLSVDGGVLPPPEPGPVAAIPEPHSYALMLAGLGLVAVMARRRRRSGSAQDAR